MTPTLPNDSPLPVDANIYASAYNLYLPDKKLLEQKLREWSEGFEE